jgi:hypothetical protein
MRDSGQSTDNVLEVGIQFTGYNCLFLPQRSQYSIVLFDLEQIVGESEFQLVHELIQLARPRHR